MLNFFREHAGSWLIKVALFLIVIVFIFWGGYSLKSQRANQIAIVDGHYISITDYNHTYDNLLDMYRRQLGNAFSQELIKQLDLKKQALDMLINRYLLAQSAQKLGLSATPEEVQQKILEYPVFQTDGKFDQKRYVFMLRQNRLTPEMFEQQMASDLTISKLETFIKRRAVVTDEDFLADFRFNRDLVQLSYVLVDPKSFEAQVSVDESLLQAFFEEHKDEYKEPEKRQLPFVLFKTDDYAGELKIDEDRIKEYYEDHRSEYHKEKEVRARHILFAVKEDAPEDEVVKVRSEAQKVLDQARKEKDFAALATKYSQDPGSAQNGGDLGLFSHGRMVPEFADAAFALKPGEISDLVRTPYGFHIIKLEEVHPEKTIMLEEARGQIKQTLKQEKARDIAYNKARDFADKAYAQREIEKTAQSLQLQINGSELWVSRADKLPGLDDSSRKVMDKFFEMSAKETSNALEVPQGFVVGQVKEIQAPTIPPFENVKSRVEMDFKRAQEIKLARENAEALLALAKEKKNLEDAAREKKFEAKKSAWFSRREPDKDLRLTGETQNKVFQLQDSIPFPDFPLNLENRFLVCQLLGTKSPADILGKERDSTYKRLLQQKQDQLWQSWVEQLRQKADVKTFEES